LRGVGAELDGSLKGGLSEHSEQVADLLLAVVDDLASGSGVDGGGHLQAQFLEATTQLLQKHLGGKDRFGGHRFLRCQVEQRDEVCNHLSTLGIPLNVGAPEKLATPLSGTGGDAP
jgi:hypothetical protein